MNQRQILRVLKFNSGCQQSNITTTFFVQSLTLPLAFASTSKPTPKSEILLENPVFRQAVKMLLAFHINRKFYAMSQYFVTNSKYT